MIDVVKYLEKFRLNSSNSLFENSNSTTIEFYKCNGLNIPKFINEYWTSKQRQANSLHEISYRACFKPQLPKFFIELLTKENDVVYDPFSGRGTTSLEAAILNRRFIANDINPLSLVLLKPRVQPPEFDEISQRLDTIDLNKEISPDTDLSMFYHPNTLKEILSLKHYLINRINQHEEDYVDEWIRMVVTNRLTGHSKGFFSVFTLPPNQAVSQSSQIKINLKRNQKPDYRNVKNIIKSKSKDLLKDVNKKLKHSIWKIKSDSLFLNCDARSTGEINSNSVSLTITSPPFLDVVQYANDNWIRCWFNNFDVRDISNKIEMAKSLDMWCSFISNVFSQLFRITKYGGYVAFEVGEVRNGKVNLEEHVVNIGLKSGFNCLGIIINEQVFTKTSNIWGISNNNKGTNSNRIVLFNKL